jgi:hypothetical protein
MNRKVLAMLLTGVTLPVTFPTLSAQTLMCAVQKKPIFLFLINISAPDRNYIHGLNIAVPHSGYVCLVV